MIKIRDLEVKLGNFKLVIPRLDISDGEYLIVMGPSGVGKTIFLNTLAGFIKPYRGRIYLNNLDITDQPPEYRRFAIIPEDYGLFPHMTVYGNISYGLKVRGLNDSIIKARVIEIAKILEIDKLLDRYPDSLSAGQKQRVALARALIINPNVILLDEPLKSLDPRIHAKAISFLKEIHSRIKFTAIHVTHNIIEAVELGDEIAFIKDGCLIGVFKPVEFLNSMYGRQYLDSMKPLMKLVKFNRELD